MGVLDKLYQANLDPLYVNGLNTKDTFDDINRTNEAGTTLYAGINEPDTLEGDYQNKKGRVDAYRQGMSAALEGDGHYKDRYKQALTLQNRYKNDPILNKMVQSKAEKEAYHKEVDSRKDLSGEDASLYKKLTDQGFTNTGATQRDPQSGGFKTYSTTQVNPVKEIPREEIYNSLTHMHPSGYTVKNGEVIVKDENAPSGFKIVSKATGQEGIAKEMVKGILQTEWDKNERGIQDSQKEKAALELVKMYSGKMKDADGNPLNERQLYDYIKANPEATIGNTSLSQSIANRRTQFLEDGADYLGFKKTSSETNVDFPTPAKGDGSDSEEAYTTTQSTTDVIDEKTQAETLSEVFRDGSFDKNPKFKNLSDAKKEELKNLGLFGQLSVMKGDLSGDPIEQEYAQHYISLNKWFNSKLKSDDLDKTSKEYKNLEAFTKKRLGSENYNKLSEDNKRVALKESYQGGHALGSTSTFAQNKAGADAKKYANEVMFNNKEGAKFSGSLKGGILNSTIYQNGREITHKTIQDKIKEGSDLSVVNRNDHTFSAKPYGTFTVSYTDDDNNVKTFEATGDDSFKVTTETFKYTGQTPIKNKAGQVLSEVTEPKQNVNSLWRAAEVHAFRKNKGYLVVGNRQVPFTAEMNPDNESLEITIPGFKEPIIVPAQQNSEDLAILGSRLVREKLLK